MKFKKLIHGTIKVGFVKMYFILKSILSQVFVHNYIAFCQRPGQA